ncbi:hypothetical protein [Paraburkholderia solisilvae]|uniref:Glycosyltransferase RgtA/B/C/D-like domain-containing protein n=2 Tax=Paraburkholderia solisilvae TaxID=624376 RepID=A0A6J5DVB7_9BURK|nr:hypothetical protein LMG29739_02816 [Paraburkholderia solisilvae]
MEAGQFYRWMTGVLRGLTITPASSASIEAAPPMRVQRARSQSMVSRWSSTRSAYCLAIFIVLAAGALAAGAFGFLTVDSWNYLHLAQSIRDGRGCTVDGAYFAVFPCGYPLAIALTAPAHDIASLMLSSKATNLILAFGGFWLLMKTFRNVLVPALIIINPLSIGLYQYTWSENLFLFAFCGAVYAISRIHRGERRYWNVSLLALFLVAGCSARYFFAPFAAAIFIGVWLAYGRKTALVALPAFVLSAVFFVAYQKFNIQMTGFGTGMGRIPAPETFGFLTVKFVVQLAKEGVWFSVAAVLLLWLARKYGAWPLQPGRAVRGDGDARACRLLMFSGVAFLLLAFYLRTQTQYDLYSPRTISYGLTFVAAASIGMMTRARSRIYPALPVAVYGVFSLLVAQDLLLPFQLKDALANGYVFPPHALVRHHSENTDADVIVNLRLPDVAPLVDGFYGLYYPPGKTVLEMQAAPYRIPDTAADLKSRIADQHARSCVVDFTPFKTRDELQNYLDQTYPVQFRFASFAHAPDTIERPDFAPSMKEYLLRIFQPGQYVRC